MEVVDARELRQLIVSRQPGIAVDFGRQDQAAVERLEDEVVVPEVDTR
jgi:hypothetical protein